MKTTIKLILSILILLSSVFGLMQSVFAISLYNVSINASNDASLSFSDVVNTTEITIGSNFVALEDFTFNDSRYFWTNPTTYTKNISLLNWTTANTNIDSHNMIVYFKFYDLANNSYLTNYDFGAFSSSSITLPIFFTYFTPQTYTWTFEKLGFTSTNITFTINTTNHFNNTYNISNSKIIVKIYDRETDALITELVTITLIATTGYNTTTTTGEVNISNINFISQLYQIIATSQNYTTESVYFNYNNQQTLNVNIYMISNSSTDSGYITIQALSDTGYRVQNAICNALEWKSSLSAYQSVAEGLTNINGETNLNIEIGTKLYKFSCTKDGTTAYSSPAIISATGQTLPIILITTISQPQNLLGGITGTFVNTTYNSTHDRLTFTFADSNSLVTEACIKTYSVAGTNKRLLSSSCLSSDSGEIQTLVNRNNTFKLVAEATVIIDTQTYPIAEPIVYPAYADLGQSLKEYNLDILIPLLLIIIAIIFGLVISPQNIYISEIGVIIAVWVSTLIVPSVISVSIALFVTLITGLMLWGGLKPR